MGVGGQGDALIGTVLDGVYRISGVLGAGTMGVVYSAEHTRLGNRVAVKVMARDLAANALALARFRREAEITGRLGHPHIVHVFDFGTAPSGEPFLVMEYLEGEDLERRIQRVTQHPVSTVLQIVKQTASALAATHARGIVHRDLKPANIFLQEIEGEPNFVKVVDFGVSKARAATLKLTQSLAIVGTPMYMAPEQAGGRPEDIDHRADQWALACIAYELLAGVPPFQADDLAALLYRVVHVDPALLGVKASDLPSEVEAVIRRALSKKPDDRFPTITAFARAFDKAIVGEDRRPLKVSDARTKSDAPVAAYRAADPVGRRAETLVSRIATLWTRTRNDTRFRRNSIVVAAVVVAAVGAIGVQLVRRASAPREVASGVVNASPAPQTPRSILPVAPSQAAFPAQSPSAVPPTIAIQPGSLAAAPVATSREVSAPPAPTAPPAAVPTFARRSPPPTSPTSSARPATVRSRSTAPTAPPVPPAKARPGRPLFREL